MTDHPHQYMDVSDKTSVATVQRTSYVRHHVAHISHIVALQSCENVVEKRKSKDVLLRLFVSMFLCLSQWSWLAANK